MNKLAEEVGIVMSLYDKVSPTLKAISGNTKAFDKSLDDLEQSLKAYEKAQESMVKQSADLKKAMAEADQKVKDAQKSYRKLKDETSKGALDAAIDEQERLRQRLSDTEAAIKANRSAYRDLYKSAQDAARGMSKLDNRAARTNGGREGDALLNGLAAAGIGSLWSDAVRQLGDAYLSSAIGEPDARIVSGILSGAISGGTMGSVFGPQGIAIADEDINTLVTTLWTVVGVLIALVGLGASIIKPIVTLTQSITKLTVVVERIE